MINISTSDNHEIINFKTNHIHYQNTLAKIILVKSLTEITKYEKIKVENKFYEMLTATVSHEMRTPLNSIITLIHTLEPFVQGKVGLKQLTII